MTQGALHKITVQPRHAVGPVNPLLRPKPAQERVEPTLEIGVCSLVPANPGVGLGIGPAGLLDLDGDTTEDEGSQGPYGVRRVVETKISQLFDLFLYSQCCATFGWFGES